MTGPTARAAVVTEHGAPITVRDVPVPASLAAGSLLVDILACSVCGTDVHGWQGELTIPAKLPSIPGHEMVGRISAMGPDGDRDSFGTPLRIGDRVIWTHASCGRCDQCAVHRDSALCRSPAMYGYASIHDEPHLLGGFAEQAYVLPGSGRVRVPDDVPDALAGVAACAVRSAAKAVDVLGAMTPEDTVLVQGSGPVGLFTTAMLAVRPHRDLIVAGAPDDRLHLASDFGATATVSIERLPDATERREAVLDLTGRREPGVVLEMSGGPTAVEEGLRLIAKNGRYILMGQVSGAPRQVSAGLITMRNLTVTGAFSGSVLHYRTALRFLSRYQDRFDFARMISGTYRLDDVDLVMNRMRDHLEVKPVMVP